MVLFTVIIFILIYALKALEFNAYSLEWLRGHQVQLIGLYSKYNAVEQLLLQTFHANSVVMFVVITVKYMSLFLS